MYKFDEIVERPVEYLLCFYDNNGCYDEQRIRPDDYSGLGVALHWQIAVNDMDRNQNDEYRRMYAIMPDGHWFEIMKVLSEHGEL